MLRIFAVSAAAALLFVSPLARATQPLPPPPPPPPGYHVPVPSAEEPREPEKPPPAPPRAPAPRKSSSPPRPSAPGAARRSPGPSLQEPEPPDGEVAVHIHGDQPQARYQLFDPDFTDPVASCTGSCTMYVPPGHYRLHVAATNSTREGTSSVDIGRASRLDVSPRGYSGRWIGLGTAIAGMGALVGGVALFATTDSSAGSQSDSRFTAGLVTFLAGAAMTPIGWVVFGKSFRPSVRVLPERGDDEAAAGLGIGPGGLTFRARF